MAEIKAGRVDAYLSKPDPRHSVFLIYGPDRGLVSERAHALARSCGAILDDPFATIRISADEAASDPERVASEAHTVSMFGGKRLIWISGSTQKQLIKALQPVLDLPPEDAVVIVEAGELKKTSPLRKQVEKSESAAALPCFQDGPEALRLMIDGELQAAGLQMGPEARDMLVANLGDDRLASRSEVQKLCLYAVGQEEITARDVMQLTGDSASLSADSIVDAAACGDAVSLERDMRRMFARGSGTFQLLNAAQRHFQTLHSLATRAAAQGQPARAMAKTARPPFYFQRLRKAEEALDLWPEGALRTAMKRINMATLDSRANAALGDEIVTALFFALTAQAQRQRQRRRTS